MIFGLGKHKRRREIADLFDDNLVAFLEPGMEMEGKVRFGTGMIRLNTHVKGEIQCEGTIVVADQGEIEGEIHTRLISIAGKVKGTVHAAERLEIKEHGILLGDIYTPCLVIDPGGYFDGQCHMPSPEPQSQATKHAEAQNRS